jgi:competence protein ComEC
MLLDGGGTYHDRVDIGALQVAPFLWRRRVIGLDRVILSHPHPDHMNGLRFIVKHFRTGEIWDNGDHPPTVSFRAFYDLALQKGITPQRLYRGNFWRIGDAVVEVLHPPREGAAHRGGDHGTRTNNASAVLKMALGGVSFLFPGDIEAETEAWLVEHGGLRSTVLIAPHHGSRTSSTEAFLDAVSPKCVVFSSNAGWWELVHPEVVQRYVRRGILVYHTGEDGMVSLATDGETLNVQTHLTRRYEQIDLGHDTR